MPVSFVEGLSITPWPLPLILEVSEKLNEILKEEELRNVRQMEELLSDGRCTYSKFILKRAELTETKKF